MALNLLRSDVDWERHRDAFLADNNVNVSWDGESGPKSFPCLVGTTIAGNNIVCMFVYPEDVRLLAESEVKPTSSSIPKRGNSSSISDIALVGMVRELIQVGVLKENFFNEALNAAEAELDYYDNNLRETLLAQFRSDRG